MGTLNMYFKKILLDFTDFLLFPFLSGFVHWKLLSNKKPTYKYSQSDDSGFTITLKVPSIVAMQDSLGVECQWDGIINGTPSYVTSLRHKRKQHAYWSKNNQNQNIPEGDVF